MVNKLLFDDASGGVAKVCVSCLVKEVVRIVVVGLTQSLKSSLYLLVLKKILNVRVLDQLVDDTLKERIVLVNTL